MVMQHIGGKLLLFQTSAPSLGAGKVGWAETAGRLCVHEELQHLHVPRRMWCIGAYTQCLALLHPQCAIADMQMVNETQTFCESESLLGLPDRCMSSSVHAAIV